MKIFKAFLNNRNKPKNKKIKLDNDIIKQNNSSIYSSCLSKSQEEIFDMLTSQLEHLIFQLTLTCNNFSLSIITDDGEVFETLNIHNFSLIYTENIINDVYKINISSVDMDNNNNEHVLSFNNNSNQPILVEILYNKNSSKLTIDTKLDDFYASIVPEFVSRLYNEIYSPIIFSFHIDLNINQITFIFGCKSVKLNIYSTILSLSCIKLSISDLLCDLMIIDNNIENFFIRLNDFILITDNTDDQCKMLFIPSINIQQYQLKITTLDIKVPTINISITHESLKIILSILISISDRIREYKLLSSFMKNNYYNNRMSYIVNNNSNEIISSHMYCIIAKINKIIINSANKKEQLIFIIKNISSNITLLFSEILINFFIDNLTIRDNTLKNGMIFKNESIENPFLRINHRFNKLSKSNMQINIDSPIIYISKSFYSLINYIESLQVLTLPFFLKGNTKTIFSFYPEILITGNITNASVYIIQENNDTLLLSLNLTLSHQYHINTLSSCIVSNKCDLFQYSVNNVKHKISPIICSIPFSLTVASNSEEKIININIFSLLPIKINLNSNLLIRLYELILKYKLPLNEIENSIVSFLTFLNSVVYKINIDIKITDISISLISDVYSSSFPFLLLKVPILSMKIINKSKICLDTLFSFLYYDRIISYWQPIIEECSMKNETIILFDSNNISFSFSTVLLKNNEASAIEINLIPSFIHEVISFIDKYHYLTTIIQPRSTNLIIKNYTGLTLYNLSIPSENMIKKIDIVNITNVVSDINGNLCLLSLINEEIIYIYNYKEFQSKRIIYESLKVDYDNNILNIKVNEEESIILLFSDKDSLNYWNNVKKLKSPRPNSNSLNEYKKKSNDTIIVIDGCQMYNTHVPLENNDYRNIQFQIAYEIDPITINIDKCKSSFLNIRYNKSYTPIIIDVSSINHQKSINIHSALKLTISKSIHLSIIFFSEENEIIETQLIDNDYYIPIRYYEEDTIIQFELSSGIKSKKITLSYLLNHYNNDKFNILLLPNNYLLCHVNTSYSTSLKDNSTTTLYNIEIMPSLVIINTTFEDIKCKITDNDDNMLLNTRIKKSEHKSIIELKSINNGSYKISLHNYRKDDIVQYESTLFLEEPISIPYDRDLLNKLKYVTIRLVSLQNGSFIMYIYNDLWIINHSGIDLYGYSKNNSIYIPHTTNEKFENIDIKRIINNGIIPYSFSNSHHSKLSFSTKVDYEKSIIYDTKTLNVHKNIQVPKSNHIFDEKLYNFYDITVVSSILNEDYYNTKIVEILPLYWIRNNNKSTINIKQVGSSNIITINENTTIPFQWEYIHPKLIQIQVKLSDEISNWSGELKIENNPITIRLYNKNYTRYKYFNISYIIIKGSFIFCIKETEFTSHSILNDCLNHSITILEQNTHPNSSIKLLPFTKSNFGFIYPNSQKLISIIIRSYNNYYSNYDIYYKSFYLLDINFVFDESKCNQQIIRKKNNIQFTIRLEYHNKQFMLYISSTEIPSLPLTLNQSDTLRYKSLLEDRINIIKNKIEEQQRQIQEIETLRTNLEKSIFNERPSYMFINVFYGINMPYHTLGTFCLFDNRKNDSSSCFSKSNKNCGFYSTIIIKTQSIIDVFICNGNPSAKNYIAKGEIDIHDIDYNKYHYLRIPLKYALFDNNDINSSLCYLFIGFGFTNYPENYIKDNSSVLKCLYSSVTRKSLQNIQNLDKEYQYCYMLLNNHVDSLFLTISGNTKYILSINKTRLNKRGKFYIVIQTVDNIYRSNVISANTTLKIDKIKYILSPVPNITFSIYNNQVIISKIISNKCDISSDIFSGLCIYSINGIIVTKDNIEEIYSIITDKTECTIEVYQPKIHEYIWNYQLELSEREYLNEIFIFIYQYIDNDLSLMIKTPKTIDNPYGDSFHDSSLNFEQLPINLDDNYIAGLVFRFNNHILYQSILLNDNITSIDINSMQVVSQFDNVITDIKNQFYISGLSLTFYDNTPNEIFNILLSTININFNINLDTIIFDLRISNTELTDTSGTSLYPIVLYNNYNDEYVFSLKITNKFIIDMIRLTIPVYLYII